MVETYFKFTCDRCEHSVFVKQSVCGSQPFLHAVHAWKWELRNDGNKMICLACCIREKVGKPLDTDKERDYTK